ncbi:MAG: NUDIX hydrolase [Patescibacteria group bacterium]
MNLINNYKGHSSVEYIFEYSDSDSFDNLDFNKCTQVYGVCFYGDKIVIGYGGAKKSWGLIGGTIEKGETFEQTLVREIQEESNMKVLSFLPIGYQKVIDTRDNSFYYQLRYVCLVQPYGPFVSDPALSVTEIKLIDPKEYKQYFDWGSIGDRIIERALELKPKHRKSARVKT